MNGFQVIEMDTLASWLACCSLRSPTQHHGHTKSEVMVTGTIGVLVVVADLMLNVVFSGLLCDQVLEMIEWDMA
jgi:hypothetical protein